MKKFFSIISGRVRNQLILSFALLFSIAGAFLIFFSYYRFSTTLQKNYTEYTSSLLFQLESYVSSYFDTCNNSTLQIYSDVIMSPDNYSGELSSHETYSYIIKQLQTIYLQRKEIKSIGFYSMLTQEFYAVDTLSSFSVSVDNSAWDPTFFNEIQRTNRLVILPKEAGFIFPEQCNLKNTSGDFTIARSIKNNDKVVALLFINYNSSSLNAVLEDNADAGSNISLYDLSGRFVAGVGPENEKEDPSIFSNMQDQRGVFQTTERNDEALYIYQKVNNYPLLLLKKTPLQNILHQAQTIRNELLQIGLCFLIVIIAGITLLSFHLTSRIMSLKKCINDVGEGNFNIQLTVEGNDEISDISKSFLAMSQKVQSLIVEKYSAELETQRATIRALNAQINPHFLYNTLQTISSIAHEEGVSDIEIMTKSLSNMFRYSITPSQEENDQLTTIQRELQNCEDYLKLLSFRYHDRLLYTITIAPTAANIIIPRLSLQPLVENAIIHGMTPDDSCIVLINATVRDNKCIITITDNGSGIKEEELLHIKETLHSNYPKQYLGLYNVYKRFVFLYQNSFEFDITSVPLMKTSVIITISNPKHTEEK